MQLLDTVEVNNNVLMHNSNFGLPCELGRLSPIMLLWAKSAHYNSLCFAGSESDLFPLVLFTSHSSTVREKINLETLRNEFESRQIT